MQLTKTFFRDFYNWTMTFRRDSDIIDSYGPYVAKFGENPGYTYAYKLRPKGILKWLNFKLYKKTFYVLTL